MYTSSFTPESLSSQNQKYRILQKKKKGHWVGLVRLYLSPVVPSLTWVYPNSNCKTLGRHVVDSEDLDGAEEVQSHRRYFQSVLVAVADGNATGHHVCITDGLHLGNKQKCTYSI